MTNIQSSSVSSTSLTTPLWAPDKAQIAQTNMASFMKLAVEKSGKVFDDYDGLWRWSVDDLQGFWDLVWDFCGVVGDKGTVVLEQADAKAADMRAAQFFPQARLNWAENMLKRCDDAPAMIFRDEQGRERIFTFAQVADKVSRLQRVLKQAGVVKGDRVAGFMPNMPATIIGAIATASLGAVWSSASPDFGVQGVIDRFGQIEPKVLLCTDGYFYNGKTLDCLDRVREIQKKLTSIQKTLVVPFVSSDPDLSGMENTERFDYALDQVGDGPLHFERVGFNHPLFIMFSSGTTGVPKCIVHGHGGTLLQHMKEHQLQCDIKENDRVFYFTTCGWMMWNWLISAMASGATLLVYDGSPFYPDYNGLWDFAAKHRCTLFGTGAKYIDMLKANNVVPKDHFDLSSVRTLTSTGSPLVHESFDYIYKNIKADLHVASISGGTDIVSCFVLGNPVSPVWRGEIQGAGLGLAIDVFDESGKPIPPGSGSGELVCVKPFPSMPIGFWNDDDGAKYKKAYFDSFPNVWCHGDWIERTDHGGFIIHGRSDATLNPGGVRIGTAEIYRQVEQVPEVLESIAVGQDWQDDVRVILFVRLKDSLMLNDDLAARIKKQIREGTSPRHVPAKVLQVADIPRTKSNKLVELAVREVIHGRPVKNKESLANPEALDLYRDIEALKN